MTKDAKNLIVGLDIGTSKVVAVVAEVMSDGRHEVIGLGQHESKGLKKGVVVNIEATVESIQRALEEAELMADCKIRNVYAGIAGSHIRSFNSSGMVAIKDKEVTATDVARVIETAKAVNIPTDQQLLHTVPQEFIVDSQEDVREPIGMSGIRLEVKVHIVTGAVSAVQNIVKCVRKAMAMSLVIWSPAMGITAVWRIAPSLKMAMSVVPLPMSTSTTPSSFSSSVSTARLDASGCRIRSCTSSPQRRTHLTMFCAALTAPVTMCTFTSSRIPLMPIGSRTSS